MLRFSTVVEMLVYSTTTSEDSEQLSFTRSLPALPGLPGGGDDGKAGL